MVLGLSQHEVTNHQLIVYDVVCFCSLCTPWCTDVMKSSSAEAEILLTADTRPDFCPDVTIS